MTIITDINNSDLISASNEVINDNFDNLNSGKIETSVIDTDAALAANSDAKLPSQKAVKAYVDNNIETRSTLAQTTSTAPSINTDTYNRYTLSAQKSDITSFTSGLTGSPSDGDSLGIRITNGVGNLALVNYSEYHDTSSDTAVVTKPSGTATNDIMFAVIESATAYSNGLPSGWTSLAQNTSTGFYELAYKVAASEGTDYTFTFAAAQQVKITILTYSGGFNITDPIDTFSNTPYVTSNTSNIAASMNVTYENSPLLFFGVCQGTSAVTATKPTIPSTAWVEDYDSGNTDPDYWLEACSMTWGGKGDTGDMTSTLSATKTNKHAFAVALKPVVSITWGNSFDSTQDGIIQKGDIKYYDLAYNSTTTKWVSASNRDIPQVTKFVPLVSPLTSSTNFDISNPSGTTFRYTYDGTGTNPQISAINYPIGSRIEIYGGNFTAANNGVFTITGSGANYFEVTNASGVAENNVTMLGTGFLYRLQKSSTWTKPTGLKYAVIEVVGGGNDGGSSGGGGGGAGGYSKKVVSNALLGSTETVTVGARGATSSMTITNGVTIQATGGSTGNSSGYGGAAGVGSNGDINMYGQAGGTAGGADTGSSGTDNKCGGAGGASQLGGGARGGDDGAAGVFAYGYGGGGGGAGSASTNIGRGFPGAVIITEYFV